MYTTVNPLNDRFGFKVKGTFKCAYNNEKNLLIIGFIPIGAVILLIILTAVYIFGLFDENGRLKGNFIEIVYDSNLGEHAQSSEENALFALAVFTLYLLLILIAVMTVIYIFMIAFLHCGKKLSFEANETRMTVFYPKRPSDVIMFKELVSVKYSERKFLLGTKGYDITVTTAKREYYYRFIHNSFSRSIGISGTPFNILLEYTRRNIKKPENITENTF